MVCKRTTVVVRKINYALQADSKALGQGWLMAGKTSTSTGVNTWYLVFVFVLKPAIWKDIYKVRNEFLNSYIFSKYRILRKNYYLNKYIHVFMEHIKWYSNLHKSTFRLHYFLGQKYIIPFTSSPKSMRAVFSCNRYGKECDLSDIYFLVELLSKHLSNACVQPRRQKYCWIIQSSFQSICL